jgi:hypothetical protein
LDEAKLEEAFRNAVTHAHDREEKNL